MKTLCPLFLLLFSVFAGTVTAQEITEPRRRNVHIELQIVSMPQEVALPFVEELRDPSKAEAAHQQIQKLLAKGTAKLIGWPILTTHSGQRAVVEAINEFRYATDFLPGGVGVYLTIPQGEVVKQPDQIRGVELNAVPDAFETRNVGVTLEVEPRLSQDEKTIDLQIVPQHVHLKGMKKVTIEREKNGDKMSVEQPEFETNRVTTSLTMKNGERTLIGVFRPSDPPNHLELFILKAEAKKAE